MTPLEAAKLLNRDARQWRLSVVAAATLMYYVGGNVFPIRDGQRLRRGMVPFFGVSSPDAGTALVYGWEAMRAAEAAS